MNRTENKLLRNLAFAGIGLTLVVIILGAYTRLTDAGLGCPDWPGCYGQLTVPSGSEQIKAAEQAFPERAVESSKAWNEMIHRYFAGSLGLLVLAIFIVALRKREHHQPLKLPALLLALVTFQAALGMWTVTMKLLPIVVMAHLLGGFATLSLLFILLLRLTPYRVPGGESSLRKLYYPALIGLIILVVQIALGGWTSSNYAALVCTQLPLCEGSWYQSLDFATAFNPISPASDDYEFGVLNYYQRMTIHVTHRVWAVVTLGYLLWIAFTIRKNAMSTLFKNAAAVLLLLLTVQFSLGIANVVYTLPLAVAVAHNAVAACLLMSMVFICYSLYRKA